MSPTQIDLTWAAASDNVGVTLYRIERCSGAGCSVFGEVGTSTSTSFSNTGLAASTSYTYRVRAQDAALNLGPYSATATVSTPSGALAPVEPLPIVDSFNRRNENPLANGWSNGIGGSVETGLRVNSNTIQCTKTTTCTAWRTNPAFGPDTEVWARVSTLPGNGNQFRLYARLQNAGLAAHSGYVLRTNQLAGTDQVMLERIDTGGTVTRLTILQELAAGDTLLLRVKASTLEAWLKRGIDVDAPRERRGLDVRRRRTRRDRDPRQDRAARRLRRTLARGQSRLCRPALLGATRASLVRRSASPSIATASMSRSTIRQ